MEISGRPCRKKSSWYMMNVSERQKMETINTPYDDTFRTLLQDCPELVVPLINELFGTNYTGREVVVSNENEIFLRNPEGKKEKRVTDSNLTLISLKGISNGIIWNVRAQRMGQWKFGCGNMMRRLL